MGLRSEDEFRYRRAASQQADEAIREAVLAPKGPVPQNSDALSQLSGLVQLATHTSRDEALVRLVDEQARVRVWDGPHHSVVAEGTVVAVCLVPMLTVRHDDGTQTHHASSLPIEIQEWRPF